MNFQPTPPQFLALVVVTIGSITDIRTGKIYNWLTFPAAGLGVATQAWFAFLAASASGNDPWIGALYGALMAVAGWLVAVLIMTIVKWKIAYAGQFGHGDTKLMGAIGSFVGPGHILFIFWYYSLAYGAWYFIRVFPALSKQLLIATKTGSLKMINMAEIRKVGREPLPVAPLIAVGTVLGVLLGDPTSYLFAVK